MDVSQYLEIFIDESEEHLQTLSDCIMVLEKEPDNKDTINEVFRAAHSLKGMAGTMGFKRMQHLTHDMENVFQEVRSDHIKVTSGMIDLLFKCLDALEGYVDNIKSTSDEGTEDNEVIIKELNDFIAKTEGAEETGNTETSEAKEAAPESTQEEKAGQEKIGVGEAYGKPSVVYRSGSHEYHSACRSEEPFYQPASTKDGFAAFLSDYRRKLPVVCGSRSRERWKISGCLGTGVS